MVLDPEFSLPTRLYIPGLTNFSEEYYSVSGSIREDSFILLVSKLEQTKSLSRDRQDSIARSQWQV